MQMLVVVLNRVQKLDDLLLELSNHGIRGGTILDSMGMVRALVDEHSEIPLFGSLKNILNENRPINKTLLMVLSDDKIPIAMECVRRAVPNISEENTGIMFTVPVNNVEGLTK
ncbi:hypothetical protein K8M07_11280 [Schnuerera sp. xch1]|uniref:hypothetical protein n=1 Tax=Schnuerera sp. xch1 TaxID=2874283 RepID=UPI001CC1C22D|nr:hypothetical protein [Schnuerera sp. xch1]MBZ2175819.1 hypothetical protein [Schnuerera sp. xch1]